MFKSKKEKIYTARRDKIKDLIFYWGFMAVPLIMLIITFFVINTTAIFLAFQKYVGTTAVFAGFENFEMVINNFSSNKLYIESFRRSVYVWFLGMIVGTIVPIIFSYYVYKKKFGWRTFKVLLFLPSIFSGIITTTIFKIMADRVIPFAYELLLGKSLDPLIANQNTTFDTLLFYNLWMGLGGGLLTHLACMNTVDPSVSESAQLDGIGFFGELWHIVLPASYTVLSLGLVTSVAGIFGGTLNLYAFYGTGAPQHTMLLGYYIHVETLEADFMDYPYLSAYGWSITLIIAPSTLFLRWLVDRVGPSEDTHERKRKKKLA